MPAKRSLDDDAQLIREAATALARRMNHPAAHDDIEERAGVQLDKVSEVVMSCLMDKEDLELRLSDLAKRLGVEPSSVSRKVQKLEDAGLVERTSDPSDARACRLHLTEQGMNALKALSNARRELFREALSSWSADDRSQFADLFKRFSDDLIDHIGVQP